MYAIDIKYTREFLARDTVGIRGESEIYAKQSAKIGFDHRVGHFRPPSIVDGIPKLQVVQGLRCFYLGRRLLGVADAMIKAQKSASITAPATPFCFWTTQKHLTIERIIGSRT